jgi:hypothetical protein
MDKVLGRHVGQTAGDRLALRFTGFALSDSEVDELYDTRLFRALHHHEVVRLYVAVNDIIVVGALQPFRALDDDVELFHQVQLAARLDDRAERLALEVLHRKIGTTIAVHAELVHRDDV